MHPSKLHVIVPYFNPIRWGTRGKLHRAFEEHMLDSGVRLTTVECALRNRPFELQPHKKIRRLQVRCNSALWIKENLMDLGVEGGDEYLAFLDGDIHFRNRNWASDTVHALQQYAVVQPWEHAYDLGPRGGHLSVWHAWARQWYYGHPCGSKRDHPYIPYAHCGYGWAMRRSVYDNLGGLIDFAILGSADHHMAQGLIGQIKKTTPGGGIAESYNKKLMEWQKLALIHVKKQISYVPGTIEHSWHGKKEDRKYVDRWDILRKHRYDPDTDIKFNSYGVIEFAGNKPRLEHDVDRYFRQRREDANG